MGGPRGCLHIVKNNTGDRLNLGLAGEIARAEGIPVQLVIIADDRALGESTDNAGRRGLAGTIPVHKIAGASAEAGADLATVAPEARLAAEFIRTMGVAFSACTVPTPGDGMLYRHALAMMAFLESDPTGGSVTTFWHFLIDRDRYFTPARRSRRYPQGKRKACYGEGQLLAARHREPSCVIDWVANFLKRQFSPLDQQLGHGHRPILSEQIVSFALQFLPQLFQIPA